MFEPEELMARIVDLEEQLKVSEMAPPAAEQLIACLEGEIAKRDEELATCRVAVENCDLFLARIAELCERVIQLEDEHARNLDWRDQCKALSAELAAIKAQEPTGWYTEDHLDDKSATTYSKELADRWVAKGWPVFPLYAAPVPEAKAQDFDPLVCDYCNAETKDPWHGSGMLNGVESRHIHACSQCRNLLPTAKAQGVVMPEPMKRGDEGGSGEYGAAMIRGYNACLREVARLNAAHVQQPKCKTCDDNGRIGGPSFYAPDEGGEPCPDCSAPVQQVIVPDGFVLAKETVVEMPDGSKEIGYTTIGRVGIFNSAEEVFDAIRELDLPLGWVSMTTEQLLPGWILAAAQAIIDGLAVENHQLRRELNLRQSQIESSGRIAERAQRFAVQLRTERDQQAQRIGELEGLLRDSAELIKHGVFEDGICCCGASVDSHGFGDGHSPVDALAYHAGQVCERIDAALSAGKDSV